MIQYRFPVNFAIGLNDLESKIGRFRNLTTLEESIKISNDDGEGGVVIRRVLNGGDYRLWEKCSKDLWCVCACARAFLYLFP